jgi:hypothetical protein
MICLSWWLFVVVVAGAALGGFVAYFLFQWWLLSAPGARPGS